MENISTREEPRKKPFANYLTRLSDALEKIDQKTDPFQVCSINDMARTQELLENKSEFDKALEELVKKAERIEENLAL